MALAERVGAVLTVRTYNGSFRSTFPLKTDDANPKKRFTVTLGNGTAHVELESFGGTIALRRPGEPRPETERRRRPERERGDKDKDKGDGDALHHGIDAAVQSALVEVQTHIAEVVREVTSEIMVEVPNVVVAPVPRPNPQPRIR
jgi:hypothetical protein